jgi:hypothetical protein
MFDPSVLYGVIKWAAPVLGATGFALTMRKDILKRADEWANTLLNNHLNHIQDATVQTVLETKKTNDILARNEEALNASVLRDIEVSQRVTEVKQTLDEHHEKQQQVWNGILNTLAVLEDRTRRRTPRPTSRKRTR